MLTVAEFYPTSVSTVVTGLTFNGIYELNKKGHIYKLSITLIIVLLDRLYGKHHTSYFKGFFMGACWKNL